MRAILGISRTMSAAVALVALSFLLISITPGCKEEHPSGPPANDNPMGRLLGHSDCKSFDRSMAVRVTPPNKDCIEYDLHSDGTLVLKHVNAAFNCCPGAIYSNITIRNDTITVVENESQSGCRCLCLYDLDYRFDNIEPGVYTFRFIEPYTTDADEPLKFTVDLSASPAGTFCVDRNNYPWSTGGGTTEPFGRLVSHTDCLTGTYSTGAVSSFFQKTCALYEYADETLLLKHVNAVFNCCPDELAADITIANDTIRIVEREVLSNPCLCLCRYDLDYRIENLPPGTYTFVFEEPYGGHGGYGDEPLIFTANLVSAPSDTFCVDRLGYPWSGGSAQPVGRLISHTDCKSGTNLLTSEPVPGDMDCVEYHYAGGNAFSLKHINAAFNCCPGDITADITVANGFITIVEHEASSMCDCSCLYDLEYEIKNLEPRQYTLRIVEIYLDGDDQRLEFPIDLSTTPDGFVGRYRDHYPWGYMSTMNEDKAALDRMRREIISFIGTPSCNGSGDCRYIALGVKPCGGPWEYLIYSAATIDVNALKFRVSRYDAFNDAFNHRYNVASDCMYVLPPRVGCVGGVCTRLD